MQKEGMRNTVLARLPLSSSSSDLAANERANVVSRFRRRFVIIKAAVFLTWDGGAERSPTMV